MKNVKTATLGMCFLTVTSCLSITSCSTKQGTGTLVGAGGGHGRPNLVLQALAVLLALLSVVLSAEVKAQLSVLPSAEPLVQAQERSSDATWTR